MIVKDAQKMVGSIVKFVKDWYSAFSGRVLTYGCTPNTFCFGNTPRDRFSGEKTASPAVFFLFDRKGYVLNAAMANIFNALLV